WERREPANANDECDLRSRERAPADELPAAIGQVVAPAAVDLPEAPVAARQPIRAPVPVIHWAHYVWTLVVVAACGLIGWLFRSWGVAEPNIVMVFLAGVAFAAACFGRGPAIVASLLGVLVFDFCFVLPYYTFAVAEAQYVITFAVMLAIGLVIS